MDLLPSSFLFQGKRETMFFYPVDPSEKYGVFAVRWQKYKAHYYTRGEFLLSSLIYGDLNQTSKYLNLLFTLSFTHILHDNFFIFFYLPVFVS